MWGRGFLAVAPQLHPFTRGKLIPSRNGAQPMNARHAVHSAAVKAVSAKAVPSCAGVPPNPAPPTAALAPALALQGVSYEYAPGIPALLEVHLEVPVGQSLALLGANGSGKSTLLKILAGLLMPTRGRMLAWGTPLDRRFWQDDARASAFRRRVGLLMQNSDAQLFCTTVWEEIAFGPAQLGLEGHALQARVQEALELLQIGPLARRSPHRLSGGEKKKVALAAILALKPEILLLDEPSTGLDPRSQAWLAAFLSQLHAAGHTLVLASHDLDLVGKVCISGVILGEDHRVMASGSIPRLLGDSALLRQANLIA